MVCLINWYNDMCVTDHNHDDNNDAFDDEYDGDVRNDDDDDGHYTVRFSCPSC